MSEREPEQPASGNRVAILGADGLGTALAAGLWRRGRQFSLWTSEDDVAKSLRTYQENVKYLPGVKVPREVGVETDLEAAVRGAAVIVLTVHSEAIRQVTGRFGPLVPAGTVVVSAVKGLEEKTLLRMSQVMAQELPDPLKNNVAVLSGPTLALELAGGAPTGVDIAASDPEVSRRVRSALAMKRFRFKVRRDVAGVETASTFSDLYALGAGICDGLGLGQNTKAALMTRALAEMVTCSRALGGKASTLYGLAGLGDLIAAGSSPHNRNRALGEHVGQGHRLADAARGMVAVTDGVAAAARAHELAARDRLRIPLAETIYKILHAEEKPEAIVKVALP